MSINRSYLPGPPSSPPSPFADEAPWGSPRSTFRNRFGSAPGTPGVLNSPSDGGSPVISLAARHNSFAYAASELADDDLSPKSQGAPSLRRPTIPEVILNPAMSDNGSNHSPYPDEHSPTFVAHSTIPVPPIPSQYTVPEPSPLTLALPERPVFHTATSSDALLGDASGLNTPNTPFTHNPFSDNLPKSIIINSPYLDSSNRPESPTAGATPKIRVNSDNDSPASIDIPSFAPRHTSPFDDGDSTHSYDSSPKMGTNKDFDAYSTGIDSKPSSMAARRSQRMRIGTPKKGGKGGKDEKSKDGKPTTAMNRKPFESTRLKGEIYKPWLEKKDPAQRWARWITLTSILIGFAVAAIRESDHATIEKLIFSLLGWIQLRTATGQCLPCSDG